MTTSILAATAGFFVCLLAIVALRPLAVAVDLVDRPGGRKTHHGEIPIIGGIAMFLGLAVGIGLVPAQDVRMESFVAACALLVTTGLIDDRFDLSPWARLPAQAAATVLVLESVSAPPLTFGDPLGVGTLMFSGLAAYAIVVFFVVGAINAFNMLDGMDGLAGAVSLVALSAIALLASGANAGFTLHVSLVLCGAVGAFLVFNLPVRLNSGLRCFMGDAGSTLIGFVLAFLCLRLTQGPSAAAHPVSVLWFVALPIYELLWTIIRRGLRGHSPFTADREHFHHLLLKGGFGVRGAFLAYVVLASALAGIGLWIHSSPVGQPLSFALFVVAGVLTVIGMYRAHLVARFFPEELLRERRSSDKAAQTVPD